MREKLKYAIKKIISGTCFLPVMALFTMVKLKKYSPVSNKKNNVKVLLFSEERCEQDVQVILNQGFTIYSFPTNWVCLINSLFIDSSVKQSIDTYFLEEDKEVLESRERHIKYISSLMSIVNRIIKVRCAITPAMHYIREYPWAAACKESNVSFIAVHKELTTLSEWQVPIRVERWKKRKFKFLGSKLCVVNNVAKKLIAESEILPSKDIIVIGLLRMDNILHEACQLRKPPKKVKPAVTLFSFGHLTGPFEEEMPYRSHYFSLNDDYGFVNLFYHVHSAYVNAALRNPDVEFNIQLKNNEEWWIKEINAVIQKEHGVTIKDIPNCHIIKKWAPKLIHESNVVIALNSTVVLESCVLRRRTIIPVFEEAITKYKNHIYFSEYLDLFMVANSRENLIKLIEDNCYEFNESELDQNRLDKLCERYLGFSDGKTGQRLNEVISQVA